MSKAEAKQHRWRIENPKAKCPRHPKKDYRILVEQAWRSGWKCEKRRKYIYCYPPDEKADWVKVPMSPSDRRTILNVKRNFRASGLSL